MEYNIGERVAVYGSFGYFELGTVTNAYIMKEDQSHHGSPYYPEVTEVKTDSGYRFNSFDVTGKTFLPIRKYRESLEREMFDIQTKINICLQDEDKMKS